MNVQELGGNIVLENFELDSQEMVIVRKMVGKYAEKIHHFRDYESIRVNMKKHGKNHNEMFEIDALCTFDEMAVTSESSGRNPFVLINDVMKMLLREVEHKVKKR